MMTKPIAITSRMKYSDKYIDFRYTNFTYYWNVAHKFGVRPQYNLYSDTNLSDEEAIQQIIALNEAPGNIAEYDVFLKMENNKVVFNHSDNLIWPLRAQVDKLPLYNYNVNNPMYEYLIFPYGIKVDHTGILYRSDTLLNDAEAIAKMNAEYYPGFSFLPQTFSLLAKYKNGHAI